MHPSALYPLLLLFVVLPAAVGTWRGFSRARSRGLDRNPGPEGSYAWIRWSLRHMPGWFNRAGMKVGTSVAFLTLPGQRACSRQYLRLALGRPPTVPDIWRHIHAYTEYLILRLGICNGEEPRVRFAPGDGDDLRALLKGGQAALYGTMHMGHSDLLGFYLGQLGGSVHMVRKKVGNSEDVERLAERYGQSVSFIWINDWSRLVLAMNDALRAGCSLALQCDRPEYSSKKEGFEFFGERLLFPFTIYHLSIMHDLPVVMSFAVPAEENPEVTEVHMLPLFHPRSGHEHRAENFAAARRHFQSFLHRLEGQLRRTPYLWFNFTPLNPPCSDALPRRGAALQRGVAANVQASVPPQAARSFTA